VLLFNSIQVRANVEETAGRKFTEYKAISYATQVVAGTNYFIKVGMVMCNLVEPVNVNTLHSTD